MGIVQEFLHSKLVVAELLALAAVLAIVLGFVMFRGKAGHAKDGTLIKWKEFQVRVGSVGATIMLSGCFLGYLAKDVLPEKLTVKPDGETEISLLRKIPRGEQIFVSAGVGTAAQYFECKRESQNLVCFDVAPGAKCGAPPAFAGGLARLQVASVLRTGTDSDTTSANNERQLRQFLADRGAKDWSIHVMNYVSRENSKPVRRIVFNSVAIDLEVPMCTWMACEGWTFGPCKAVLNDRDDLPE